MRNEASPTNIEGNDVIDCHQHQDFPIYLVEITQDWDVCGRFAVVRDCGWNPLEGWQELDYQYFATIEEARAAFDLEVARRQAPAEKLEGNDATDCHQNSRFASLSLHEVELLLDLAAGRVEDLECDDQVVPSVLANLAEELTKEHVARTNG